MGMSLDVYAYYGWHIGSNEELDLTNLQNEDDDSNFDHYIYSEKFKHIAVQSTNYYDYSNYFVVLSDNSGDFYNPIYWSRLKDVKYNKKEVLKELKIIEADFNVKFDDEPDWIFAPEYY